jgi:glutamine synthetase
MVADRLRELEEAGVNRVRVHYTDLIGTTRAKVIPLEVLEQACDEGLNFCVSVFSIDHTGVMPDGTGIRDEVNFRDMQVVADLETLRVVPWERETAICLADCRATSCGGRSPRPRRRGSASRSGTSSSSSSCGARPRAGSFPTSRCRGSSTGWTSAPTRRA